MASNKNFKAEHNTAFNADAVTIMHGEGKFVLDFKQSTPRLDKIEGDQQHTVITEHDAVVMQPRMAKALLRLLQQNIENYEEAHGEIELPEQSANPSRSTDSHNYIG